MSRGLLSIISMIIACSTILELSSSAANQVPEFRKREIVFLGGKKIKYQPYKRLNPDPKQALKARSPVSIAEKPEIIEPWQRVILTKTIEMYEDSEKQILIFDYYGRLLGTSPKIIGDPVIKVLEKTDRIFLGQRSAHFSVKKSFLLNTDGTIVREIAQDENVFDFGFSTDGRLLWVLSNHLEEGRPVGEAKIIDSNGVDIQLLQFTDEKEILVEYSGHKYKIRLPRPEIPG